MTLDLSHALDYLQGDKALLVEFLALFSNTVDDLRPLVAIALRSTPASTSQPAWNDFYRALHGAKPAILVVGAAPLRLLVDDLSQALSTGEQGETVRLANLLAPQLETLADDVARVAASGV